MRSAHLGCRSSAPRSPRRPAGSRRPPRARRRRARGRPRRSRRSRSPASAAPRSPRACGSISRSSSAAEPPQPRHPVGDRRGARARRSAGSSAASSGHDQLAAALGRAIPRASQYSHSSRAPSTHSLRLQRAGGVVDAGVDRRRCCGRSGGSPPASSRSSTTTRDPGRRRQQLAGDGQPEDPGPHHYNVGVHLLPAYPQSPSRSSQAKCTSAASSSSTGRSQVGQYQTASSGVPQAEWRGASTSSRCRAPQSDNRRSAPASSRPEAPQLVDEARRTLRVALGQHEALRLEVAQALGEDVGRDPGQLALEVAEAPRPVEQRGDDQERPAVADARERLCQR